MGVGWAAAAAAVAVEVAAVPAWSASSRFCYTLFIGLSTLLVQVCVLGLVWARRRLRRWRRRYVPLEAWEWRCQLTILLNGAARSMYAVQRHQCPLIYTRSLLQLLHRTAREGWSSSCESRPLAVA